MALQTSQLTLSASTVKMPPVTNRERFEFTRRLDHTQKDTLMARPITKADLVADIAAHSDISKAEAAIALDAVTAVISARLVAGDAVTLPGVAKFETRERPARQVRNVATGAMMDKDADRAVKISALTGIKVAVNTA
jgi:DNA-binding protein HU-beta